MTVSRSKDRISLYLEDDRGGEELQVDTDGVVQIP